MFKTICKNHDIPIERNAKERMYRLFTSVKLSINNKHFIELIKNKQFYDLITMLNPDMIEELGFISESESESESVSASETVCNMMIILKDFIPEIRLSKQARTIYFTNRIIIIGDKWVELVGNIKDTVKGKYKEELETMIEHIIFTIKEENDAISIELRFKYGGNKSPIFVENIGAFMFRKLIYRVKCYLEKC
jgi:hypothetical protein